MTTLEQLIAMRELLTPPECWTKGAFARDKFDVITTSYSPDAVRWCLYGAMYKVGFGHDIINTMQTLPLSLSVYNDHPTTTHADILKLLDTAIENEKEKINHDNA